MGRVMCDVTCNERRAKMYALVSQGMSYEDVGKQEGLSRQRVHQLVSSYAAANGLVVTERTSEARRAEAARRSRSAKSLSEMFPKESAKTKSSRRGSWRKQGIDITDEAYDLMYLEQGGLCRICGKPSKERLHVDHDHQTGKVRGLLCFYCNTALGLLGDDPDILLDAADYLLSSNSI